MLLAKLVKLEEAVSLMRDRLEQTQAKVAECRVDIDALKVDMENIKNAMAEVDRLGRLIEEANKLWVFFQRFIDE